MGLGEGGVNPTTPANSTGTSICGMLKIVTCGVGLCLAIILLLLYKKGRDDHKSIEMGPEFVTCGPKKVLQDLT